MKILLFILFLVGVVSAFQAASTAAALGNLSSEFKAFEAKASQDSAGLRILALGGEVSNENFDSLVEKLNKINPNPLPGLITSLLSLIGLVISFKNRNKSNKLVPPIIS